MRTSNDPWSPLFIHSLKGQKLVVGRAAWIKVGVNMCIDQSGDITFTAQTQGCKFLPGVAILRLKVMRHI